MSNYDLEEIKLIKAQIILSVLTIITVLISLELSFNEILKLSKSQVFFKDEIQKNILIFNRILALFIALGFLYINYVDRNIKSKYNNDNLKDANLQISASALTVIASIIVLFTSFSSEEEIGIENPEL